MKSSKPNYKLLIPMIIFALISVPSIGLIMSQSTQTFTQSSLSMVIKQTVGFFAGFVAIFIILKIDLSKVNKLVNIFYYILLIMLFILVAGIPGVSAFFTKTINGASGWFRFFPGGPTIQPVEFMKIAMIFKLGMVSQHHFDSPEGDGMLFKRYAIYGLLPILLVFAQPDLGGAILLGVPWLIMFLMSIKNKGLARSLCLGMFIFLAMFIYLVLTPQGQAMLVANTPLQAYQLERINAWLTPFDVSTGLQLQQSLILMGSAGPFGHGVFYNAVSLPEAQTDMIFAKIAGMYGYSMGVFIIFLYFIMINEMINIAGRAKELMYKLVVIGFAGLFIIQVTENIGMIIGLLPITGIVLPFVSYGVSALITYSVIIGLIMNIDNRTEKEED